jgi:hypothetical protein
MCVRTILVKYKKLSLLIATYVKFIFGLSKERVFRILIFSFTMSPFCQGFALHIMLADLPTNQGQSWWWHFFQVYLLWPLPLEWLTRAL